MFAFGEPTKHRGEHSEGASIELSRMLTFFGRVDAFWGEAGGETLLHVAARCGDGGPFEVKPGPVVAMGSNERPMGCTLFGPEPEFVPSAAICSRHAKTTCSNMPRNSRVKVQTAIIGET